jgi:hypothetical protein
MSFPPLLFIEFKPSRTLYFGTEGCWPPGAVRVTKSNAHGCAWRPRCTSGGGGPKPSSPSWLVELMYGGNHPNSIPCWSELWG